uniref:uncharacterized protein LOC122597720 n=1 Tax=Erigeron canadensis TaxID=72917 RepID=UPI001CB8D236|nr:uncharacterized protein LOC122597720 [Erigeron canadensis]
MVENMEGQLFFGNHVASQFVEHFKDVLGTSKAVDSIREPVSLFVKKVPSSEADYMCRDVSELKGVLDMIVDENQFAFIPGRQISDNILLTQELMLNYHRKRGVPKCAFKIDIQKAYDSVEWRFLEKCLRSFGFYECMIAWIMRCVTTPAYTIAVNGEHNGFFHGRRGLRQGDPLSPYLFTVVMEVLSLMIKRQIKEQKDFQYHWKCEKTKLTHLCFADDLILFCHGDQHSVSILKDALEEFSGVSGLVASMEKSESFFGNVKIEVRNQISEMLPFKVAELPVRYLGVPLISTRLYKKKCLPLIDKVKKKLLDWKNRSLSFAGKLQLIKSVLSSLQVYWSSVFILPKGVTDDIEGLFRSFLWSHGELKRGKAKVKWSNVCMPKAQGGLGIKSLVTWNNALMAKHAWNIVTNKRSFWVNWIADERLKGRNFWEMHAFSNTAWGWRKIMKNREILRSHIVYKLGNGLNTSAIFDNWHPAGPLSSFISYRDAYDAGLPINATVADVVKDNEWCWPRELSDKYPVLLEAAPPELSFNRMDRILWKKRTGRCVPFSVQDVFHSLSEDADVVKWARLVWFSQNIPRHAFILWLALKRKLKTQDKFLGVEGINLVCIFCSQQCDSHNHLFFYCVYPREVWNEMKLMANLDEVPNSWDSIVDCMSSFTMSNAITNVVQRLVLAATVYFVWQERNFRLFQNKTRNVKDLCGIIKHTVRARLIGLKIKSTAKAAKVAEIWNFELNKGINEDNFKVCLDNG